MKDTCEIYCYDEAKVNRIRSIVEVADTKMMARIFKALSDETRMKITYALSND